MKKIVCIPFLLLLIAACNNATHTSSPAGETDTGRSEKAIGGQKDAHGCLTAAGETWSELQQGCIQVFNSGTRLNPVTKTRDGAILSAFILASNDGSRLELFLPDSSSTVLLEKSAEDIFQNGRYSFHTVDSALYIDKVKQYQSKTD
ncbi:hypothetical protein GCM10027051_02090 [Niabella terrae]